MRIYVSWWQSHKTIAILAVFLRSKLKEQLNYFKSDDWDGSEHFVTIALNMNYYTDFYLNKQPQNQDPFAKMLNEGYRFIDFDNNEIQLQDLNTYILLL